MKVSEHGKPRITDLLGQFGALEVDTHQSSHPFEEDLEAVQQKLLEREVGPMHGSPSTDSDPDYGLPQPASTELPQSRDMSFSIGEQNTSSAQLLKLWPSLAKFDMPFTPLIQNASLLPTSNNYPAQLQTQTWTVNTPFMFNENIDFKLANTHFDDLTNFHKTMTRFGYPGIKIPASPCIPLEWNPDADLSIFLNQGSA